MDLNGRRPLEEKYCTFGTKSRLNTSLNFKHEPKKLLRKTSCLTRGNYNERFCGLIEHNSLWVCLLVLMVKDVLFFDNI